MKKIQIAQKLMMLLFLYYLIYNSIFGWNWKPINETEKLCDDIYKIGIFIAITWYFLPLLDVYKNFIKRNEASKKD